MIRKTLILLLIIFTVGCAERSQVQTYLTAVSTEIPNLKTIGRNTEDAFDDLRFGERPKDLLELATKLEALSADLDTQIKALEESRTRVTSIPVPEAAKSLETKLDEAYKGWTEVAQGVSDLAKDSAAECRTIESAPAKEKLKRLGEAARALGDKIRALKKKSRDAKRASEDLGDELKRLQKKYKVVGK